MQIFGLDLTEDENVFFVNAWIGNNREPVILYKK